MDFRQLLFEDPASGEQYLLDLWTDAPPTLARRSDAGAVWGPPIEPLKDTARERVR